MQETFAKLMATTIMCPDSQSCKLRFLIDSRFRGHDGRFCKGILRVLHFIVLVPINGNIKSRMTATKSCKSPMPC